MRGVCVRDLAVKGTAFPQKEQNADADLILAQRTERCFFQDLTLSHFRKSGLLISRSLDVHAIRIRASA